MTCEVAHHHPLVEPHAHHHHDGHQHRDKRVHHGLRAAVSDVFRPHSHDAADSVDTELEASTQGIRAVKVSFVALLLTSVVQVVIVAATGSIALVADTIHNFSDALTA